MQALRVVLHVHSSFSGERTTLDEIALQAQKDGVDAVILTDYFQQKVSWGIYPAHRVLKYSNERPSVVKQGLHRYFEQIDQTNQKFPNFLLIPGFEITPFYWWSGDFWDENWTVHDLQKNLLVFGLDEKSAKQIPTLENGSSPFDAYHGSKGEKPYQLAIDYIGSKDGVTVWSTPDEAFGSHAKIGPVQLSTLPYSDSLRLTENYTGAAIYPEGNTETGIVGGGWDRNLMAYCRGKRAKPVWAFAEAVVHAQGVQKQLDRWEQIVWAKEKSEAAILEAIRAGRFYTRAVKAADFRLESFFVEDTSSGDRAISGEEIAVTGNPRLHFLFSFKKQEPDSNVDLTIVRDGVVIHAMTILDFDLETAWQDDSFAQVSDGRHYYRLIAFAGPNGQGNFISNPIFVRRKT